jgi:protein O-mannosyl-transferase
MIENSPQHYGHNHIRLSYQLMLIIAILLAVYYPTVFAGVSFIDDSSIIDVVKNGGPLNLRDLFTPQMQGGLYYRPILFLSFYFDRFLFNLDPGFMHLENIILHIINTLLVFWFASQLIPNSKQGRSLIPLLSALFFGVHPIATEPVCWIAGRTDVLACTFILLSANCFMFFKKSHAYRYVALAAIFMTLGFLTKEVALAFLPGAFLIMRSMDSPARETVAQQVISPQNRQDRNHYLFLLCSVGAVLFFFLMRHFAVATNEGRIGSTIRFIKRDTLEVFLIFLRALGFYTKKIYFPIPLNFAIRDVEPLYELFGVLVVVVCFLIMSKKNQVSDLFMTGIFMIIPSFPIALGQISWTFYAERYLYLPTAFIMVASVIFVNSFLEKSATRLVKKEVAVTLLLVIMAVLTFHRSMVWKDNLTFLRDTVKENPQFYYVRGQYALALAMQDDIINARMQFRTANEYNTNKKRLKYGNELFQLRYWDLPEMGLAYLLVKENRIPEATAAYEKIIQDSHGESVNAIRGVLNLYGNMLSATKSCSDSDRFKKKISFYAEKLYNTSDNADTFYWLGKIFLMRGERRAALVYFKKAESTYTPDNEYRVITQKFITRLENE